MCKIELSSRLQIILNRFFTYLNIWQERESLYCAGIVGVLPLLLLPITVATKTHLHISSMPTREEGDSTMSVSYTHLTLPTTGIRCRSRWSPYH